MSTKGIKDLLNSCYFLKPETGEYLPVGGITEITDVELIDEGTLLPNLYQPVDTFSFEFTPNFKCKLDAVQIFLTTGNDLYLKFPKKLRRRRR